MNDLRKTIQNQPGISSIFEQMAAHSVPVSEFSKPTHEPVSFKSGLDTAEQKFLSTIPKKSAHLAQKALNDFKGALEILLNEERVFKGRTRWGEKLSLTAAYLRSAQHVQAEKDFQNTAENLNSIDPDYGSVLVEQTRNAIEFMSVVTKTVPHQKQHNAKNTL
jgi:hypothetical protein